MPLSLSAFTSVTAGGMVVDATSTWPAIAAVNVGAAPEWDVLMRAPESVREKVFDDQMRHRAPAPGVP